MTSIQINIVLLAHPSPWSLAGDGTVVVPEVQQILQDIIKSQEQMKGYVKDLTQALMAKALSFEQT